MEAVLEFELERPIRDFELNPNGKDIFVGDLHGNISSFYQGLKRLEFNSEIDRVFCVGDLIDRGEDSLACLQLLNKSWFHSVLGNHELMFLESANSDQSSKTLENFWQSKLSKEKINQCLALISKMSLALTVKHKLGYIGVVHADIPEQISWSHYLSLLKSYDNSSIQYATWGRSITEKFSSPVSGVKWVFIGHQGRESPQFFHNVICIDTCSFIPKKYCKTYGLSFAYFESEEIKFLTV